MGLKTKRKNRFSIAVSSRADSANQPHNLSRGQIAVLLAILAVSLILNCVGIGWGRSGKEPWAPDSIEGITTVIEMQRMFGRWEHKYPRGQYLVNAVFYKPLIEYWKRHPLQARRADGRIVSSDLNLKRLDTLALIARLITAAMGTATVLAVFLTTRLLFKDRLAAALAALALAVSSLFVFQSHIGNVDIPCTFWYAWGLYWLAKAIYIGKWRHFILMGLFFSLSICTKDAVGGYLIGIAVAFWIVTAAGTKAEGQSFKKAVLSVFSKKTVVAVLVFLFVYALLQDILTSPAAFSERVSVWIGGRGVAGFDKHFRGQLPLLCRAFEHIYGSLGWPMLAAIGISCVYCGIKYPLQIAFAAIPVIAFYVIVVMKIEMVFARYFLPAFAGLALLVGKASADWLRFKKIHITGRLLPVAAVFILSLLYCIGLDLEMVDETRVRTEQWFYKNVSRGKIVGVGIHNIVYAPRLRFNGYRVICPCKAGHIYAALQGRLPLDYLIMPTGWLDVDGPQEEVFRKRLFNGDLGYEEVVRFKSKYLYPARTVFGFASWPIPFPQTVSPEMVIFEKK